MPFLSLEEYIYRILFSHRHGQAWIGMLPKVDVQRMVVRVVCFLAGVRVSGPGRYRAFIFLQQFTKTYAASA